MPRINTASLCSRMVQWLVGAILAGGLVTADALAESTTLLNLEKLRVTADLEFNYYQYKSERQDRSLDRWSRQFSEGLKLKLPGSVYHPKFLSFDLEGHLELGQNRQPRGSASFNPAFNANLFSYRAEGIFFRERPLFLRLGSTRSRARINGDFMVSREDLLRTTYMETRIRSTEWPTWARWQWARNDRGGRLSLTDRRYSFDLRTTHEAQTNTVRAHYGRSRFKTVETGIDVRSQFLNLSGQVRNGRKTNMQSSLRWLRQDRDLDFESLTGRVDASRKVGGGLTTRIGGSFVRNRRQGRRQDIMNTSVGGTHRLYKSLFSSANFGFSRTRYNIGNIDTQTLGLNLNYTKRIGFTQFSYGLGFDRAKQVSNFIPVEVGVFNLPRAFPVDDLIILPHRNIDVSTVSVTDSLGGEVYTEGLDYELSAQGSSLFLVRIQGGRIDPEAAVRISYFYIFENDGFAGRETVRNTIGLRLPRGFRLHTLWSRTYPLSTGGKFTLGTQSGFRNEYAISWSRRFFSAEWRNEKTLQETVYFEQNRVFGGIHGKVPVADRASIDLGMSWSRVEQNGPVIATKTLRTSVMRHVTRNMNLTLDAQFDERDLNEGVRNLWGLGLQSRVWWGWNRLDLRWSYRETMAPIVGSLKDNRIEMRYERIIR